MGKAIFVAGLVTICLGIWEAGGSKSLVVYSLLFFLVACLGVSVASLMAQEKFDSMYAPEFSRILPTD
jgi:hypothetical protein